MAAASRRRRQAGLAPVSLVRTRRPLCRQIRSNKSGRATGLRAIADSTCADLVCRSATIVDEICPANAGLPPGKKVTEIHHLFDGLSLVYLGVVISWFK